MGLFCSHVGRLSTLCAERRTLNMAFTIRNLRIRDQILLVTLPPLFALLCAVGLFFYAYWSAMNSERLAAKTRDSVTRGESLLRHATETVMAVRGFVFTRQASELDSFERGATECREDLTVLRDLESGEPAQAAEVDAIRAQFDELERNWALVTINRVKRGENVNPVGAMQEGQSRLVAIRARVAKILRADEAKNQAQMSEAEEVMRRMLVLGVSLAALLALVLLLLTRVVTRLIVEPVLQLIQASERVGSGDFEPLILPLMNNEFGVLARSFTHMTGALRREREEMAALNRFSEAVTQCTSDREVYDLLLHWLKERFQPQQVIIFILNSAENFLEAVASLLPLPKEVSGWPVIEEPHNCKAVRSGRRFLVNDVAVEPLCPSEFVLPCEGSYHCGPLIAGGIIIGAVRLQGIRNYWTPERERLLESYLSGAASALSNLRLLETMKQQANIDMLTGLYNRRFLEDYARKLFAMARRREQPVGVVMMDLDHFKGFNDIYGHEIGDRILRQFARTVISSMRETNLAARFGGEEFVVLLPDTGPKACLIVAERIRQAVARMVIPSVADKPLPQVTVSLGIAVFPEHGQTLEEILVASDKALYESKRLGRNRATVYTPQETAAS